MKESNRGKGPEIHQVDQHIHCVGIQGEKGESMAGIIFEKWLKFPSLMKDINIYISKMLKEFQLRKKLKETNTKTHKHNFHRTKKRILAAARGKTNHYIQGILNKVISYQ